MRLIGAILLILCGTAAGFLKSFRLRQRAEELRDLQAFFLSLDTEIRYAAQSTAQILNRHGSLPFCARALEQMRQGSPLCAALTAAAQSGCYAPDEKQALLLFAGSFGKTDTPDQLRCAEYCCRCMQQGFAKARQDYAAKGKLYILLGCFFSAAAALVVL